MKKCASAGIVVCLLLMGFAIFTSGCQTARMAVPPELETQADAYTCVGRGGFSLSEKFQFGPYSITHVRRGWTERFAVGIAHWEYSNTKQKYEYDLTAPDGSRWHGLAANGVKKNDIKAQVWGGDLTLGITSDLNFVTRIGQEGQEAAWTLALAQGSRDSLMNGVLTDGKTRYQIEGTHRLAGSSMPLFDASGYIFTLNGQPIASVDVINEGSVRLAKSLSENERNILSAAAAALLLYKDISEP